ncbi:MAG: metalloregulator ArsR/SmtB family transcription factor [Candidatus Omnitrophica bacterium]|nr:metalloregulator ArsR/SmtB family transcription factor [Candidatus Omnitrophota bacterium]MDD4013031.1 metalloregulator ArsR/SmtB family transcription factor [Candidatus Omnitrophota bacterium]
MSIDIEKDSLMLKAMAHPVRLKMVRGLMRNECNVGKIVSSLGLPQSTVSQHLGILRSCGIIAAKKDGVKTCYRVTNMRVRAIIKVLEG